jgi:hypothetical protein
MISWACLLGLRCWFWLHPATAQGWSLSWESRPGYYTAPRPGCRISRRIPPARIGRPEEAARFFWSAVTRRGGRVEQSPRGRGRRVTAFRSISLATTTGDRRLPIHHQGPKSTKGTKRSRGFQSAIRNYANLPEKKDPQTPESGSTRAQSRRDAGSSRRKAPRAPPGHAGIPIPCAPLEPRAAYCTSPEPRFML